MSLLEDTNSTPFVPLTTDQILNDLAVSRSQAAEGQTYDMGEALDDLRRRHGFHCTPDQTAQETPPHMDSPKMRAYLRMQELRKETAAYEVSDGQRAQALDEKFGTIG